MCKIEDLETALEVFDQVPFGISITDTDGTILTINSVFQKVTGFSREELIGKKIGKQTGIMYSGYHDDAFYSNLWNHIKSGKTFKGLIKNKRKDGHLYWQDVTISPYINKDSGEIEHFIAYILDSTVAVENENFLNRIINTIPGLTYIIDFEINENIFQSKNTERILGYNPSDFQHRPNLYDELIHPKDLQRVKTLDSIIKTFPNGETVDFEFRVRHADGSFRWLRAKEAVFDRDQEGKPNKKIGIAIDVTDEKKQMHKLNSIEESIQRLLAGSKEISEILTRGEDVSRLEQYRDK